MWFGECSGCLLKDQEESGDMLTSKIVLGAARRWETWFCNQRKTSSGPKERRSLRRSHVSGSAGRYAELHVWRSFAPRIPALGQ